MKVMHILSKKSLLGTESKQNRVVRIEEENLTNLTISEAEEMEINAKIEILISVHYSCAQCKYVTDAKNQLGNHIGAFHKDSCDQCDYITPTKGPYQKNRRFYERNMFSRCLTPPTPL